MKKVSLRKKSFLTLFIPEFDLGLDLKMEKVFSTSYESYVFMQKRKFQNFVSLKTIFKQPDPWKTKTKQKRFALTVPKECRCFQHGQ